jgi:hypothetical protein
VARKTPPLQFPKVSAKAAAIDDTALGPNTTLVGRAKPTDDTALGSHTPPRGEKVAGADTALDVNTPLPVRSTLIAGADTALDANTPMPPTVPAVLGATTVAEKLPAPESPVHKHDISTMSRFDAGSLSSSRTDASGLPPVQQPFASGPAPATEVDLIPLGDDIETVAYGEKAREILAADAAVAGTRRPQDGRDSAPSLPPPPPAHGAPRLPGVAGDPQHFAAAGYERPHYDQRLHDEHSHHGPPPQQIAHGNPNQFQAPTTYPVARLSSTFPAGWTTASTGSLSLKRPSLVSQLVRTPLRLAITAAVVGVALGGLFIAVSGDSSEPAPAAAPAADPPTLVMPTEVTEPPAVDPTTEPATEPTTAPPNEATTAPPTEPTTSVEDTSTGPSTKVPATRPATKTATPAATKTTTPTTKATTTKPETKTPPTKPEPEIKATKKPPAPAKPPPAKPAVTKPAKTKPVATPATKKPVKKPATKPKQEPTKKWDPNSLFPSRK